MPAGAVTFRPSPQPEARRGAGMLPPLLASRAGVPAPPLPGAPQRPPAPWPPWPAGAEPSSLRRVLAADRCRSRALPPLPPALAVVSAGGLRGPSPPVRSDRCLAAGAAAPPHRACLGLRGADGGGRHAGARSLWFPGGAARAPVCLTGSSVGKGKSVARSWWCGYGKCYVIPLKEEEGLK